MYQGSHEIEAKERIMTHIEIQEQMNIITCTPEEDSRFKKMYPQTVDERLLEPFSYKCPFCGVQHREKCPFMKKYNPIMRNMI